MTSLLRAAGAITGAALLLLCGGLVVFTFATTPSLTEPGQPLGTLILAVGAIAGAVLFRWSAPGATTVIARTPLQIARRAFSRSALLDPIGMAFWTLVIATVLMIPPVLHRFAIALGGFITYLLAATITLLLMSHWWYRAVTTLVATPIVMFALIFIAEAFQKDVVGEGALALVGPLMISWAVVPATGVVRLIVRALSGQTTT